MRRARLEHPADDLRSYCSPAVRRLLAQHGLDLSTIQGTGRQGRVTRGDVQAELRRRGIEPEVRTRPQSVPAPAAVDPLPPAPEPVAPTPAEQPAVPEVTRAADSETLPFSRIRQRTADRMVASLAGAAHALVITDVDYGRVDAARTAEKEAFRAREGTSLTFLPFVARAVTHALPRFPLMNALVGADELTVHRRINLGIAVDLEFEGLVVPVVKDAQDLRVRGLARRIAEVADRARRGRLMPDDVTGGTFTITNPGGFGTFVTAPIINHPQVAILSTDSVQMRPVAVALDDGSWGVAVHPVGHLSLSFDHRAVDGAYASAFLAEVKQSLETADWRSEL
jgi:pyruvate/2-oxoglutarate dehydrogenase complex dihydrolipoamide acyltransferase (E2) component